MGDGHENDEVEKASDTAYHERVSSNEKNRLITGDFII